MPLTNPFRRQSDRPSLKERAAALRADLGQPRPQPAFLPAPGSEEAVAAYRAACREETIRSQAIVEGYPDLRRGPSEWWTADSLGKAMEMGEIMPAECARLYPLATERELRLAEIEHELKLGALHALAFADSYPLPPDTHGEEASDDAELIRLGRLFEAAHEREAAACEACNAAQDEADRNMPERPAALLLRASDHPLYLRKYLTHPDMLEGMEVTAEDVEWMRRKPYAREVRRPVRPEDNLPPSAETVVEAHPWPEAQQRADEIVTAWNAWNAERLSIQHRYVTSALDDAANEAGEAAAALAERLAALPARTAEGFRVKLRALSYYRRDVLDTDLPNLPDPDQLLSHSLWRDVQGELPEATSAAGPDLLGLIDFASETMENLRALHDIANEIGSVVSAMAWTARCHTRGWATWNAPGDGHNAAGKLMHWLGDALTDVERAAINEARSRTPADDRDRGIRQQILASAIIENGDPEETAAFARELLASVER